MFTGIVKGLSKVEALEVKKGLAHYAIAFTPELSKGLELGASVSIDGICQTVVRVEGNLVWFDAIEETLKRTTLKNLRVGQKVNVERSAKFGDEIGGHVLSGHIFGTARIKKVDKWDNNQAVTFECPKEWTKYLFSKGYIALDGVSLTLVDVNPAGLFSVHLIPETLRLTTFGFKKEGDLVNLEFDSQTQSIVDTVERVLESKLNMQGCNTYA